MLLAENLLVSKLNLHVSSSAMWLIQARSLSILADATVLPYKRFVMSNGCRLNFGRWMLKVANLQLAGCEVELPNLQVAAIKDFLSDVGIVLREYVSQACLMGLLTMSFMYSSSAIFRLLNFFALLRIASLIFHSGSNTLIMNH